jgi:hypothetical protein
MIRELDEQSAIKFISERGFARLGCVLETGEPYVVPVNYLFQDNSVYIHSSPGLKLEALSRNPRACLQVDEIKNLFEWQSVIAFGTFEEVKDRRLHEEIMDLMLKIFQKLTPADAVREGVESNGERVLFRINIDRVTGRMES